MEGEGDVAGSWVEIRWPLERWWVSPDQAFCFLPGGAAMKAGVKEGDRIIKVSEIPSLGDPGGEGVQGHFWPWPVLYKCVFIASVVSR